MRALRSAASLGLACIAGTANATAIPCASCGIAGVFGPEVQAQSMQDGLLIFSFMLLFAAGLTAFEGLQAYRAKERG